MSQTDVDPAASPGRAIVDLSTALSDLRAEIREDRIRGEQTALRLEAALGELRGEISGVRSVVSELRGEIGGLRVEMREDRKASDQAMRELRGEIGALRSEMRADRNASDQATNHLAEAITELRVAVGRLDEQLKASNAALDHRMDARYWRNSLLAIGGASAIAGAVAAVVALLVG